MRSTPATETQSLRTSEGHNQIGQKYDELIAADTRDRVGLAYAVFQSLSHLAKHGIAGLVTERKIIDTLKIVEIDDHHRHAIQRSLGSLDRDIQPVAQQRPGRQPRKWIMIRSVIDILIRALNAPSRSYEMSRNPIISPM